MTRSTENASLYVLVCSLIGTSISLAFVWVATALSFGLLPGA